MLPQVSRSNHRVHSDISGAWSVGTYRRGTQPIRYVGTTNKHGTAPRNNRQGEANNTITSRGGGGGATATKSPPTTTETTTAQNGRLAILHWLRSQTPPCRWNRSVCSRAAGSGHLVVLQWLRSKNPPCPWDFEDCLRMAPEASATEMCIRTQA